MKMLLPTSLLSCRQQGRGVVRYDGVIVGDSEIKAVAEFAELPKSSKFEACLYSPEFRWTIGADTSQGQWLLSPADDAIQHFTPMPGIPQMTLFSILR